MLRSLICPTTPLRVVGVISCLCLVGPPAAKADLYQFVTVDVPGAVNTEVYGINNNGLISGLSSGSDFVFSGFLVNQGTLTQYQAPLPGGGTAVDTEFYQANNAGQVAVSYYGADGIYHSATYNSVTASWTYLPDIAGFSQNLAGGINNNGLVVGDVFTNSSYSGGMGWSFSNGQYSPLFSAPGADPTQTPGGTATYSVNDAGQIVGYFIDSSGIYHGYVMTPGMSGPTFTTLDYPGAAVNGGTEANGINNAGIVTGFYFTANVDFGFTDTSGFLWDNGTFTTLNFPGAVATYITSINDLGDLGGFYVDANGNVDGFVAYPVPEPGTLTLLAIGMAGAGAGRLLRRRARRIAEPG